MPSILRLSTKQLDELIESVEAEEGDATELIKLRDEFTETQPQKPARRQATSVVLREEETTVGRLNREAGDLFSGGVSGDILAMCIEYDRKYSLKELRKMCLEAGISPSGHKKLLAAKLIAHRWEAEVGKKGRAEQTVPFEF